MYYSEVDNFETMLSKYMKRENQRRDRNQLT